MPNQMSTTDYSTGQFTQLLCPTPPSGHGRWSRSFHSKWFSWGFSGKEFLMVMEFSLLKGKHIFQCLHFMELRRNPRKRHIHLAGASPPVPLSLLEFPKPWLIPLLQPKLPPPLWLKDHNFQIIHLLGSPASKCHGWRKRKEHRIFT